MRRSIPRTRPFKVPAASVQMLSGKGEVPLFLSAFSSETIIAVGGWSSRRPPATGYPFLHHTTETERKGRYKGARRRQNAAADVLQTTEATCDVISAAAPTANRVTASRALPPPPATGRPPFPFFFAVCSTIPSASNRIPK